MNDFNHEPLAIEIDFASPSERAIRDSDQLIPWRE
jgi:hypothetical protein